MTDHPYGDWRMQPSLDELEVVDLVDKLERDPKPIRVQINGRVTLTQEQIINLELQRRGIDTVVVSGERFDRFIETVRDRVTDPADNDLTDKKGRP